jgi:hypothetical protein
MSLAPSLVALFAISLLVMIQATSIIITGCGEISASAQTVPGVNTTVKVYYGGTVCLVTQTVIKLSFQSGRIRVFLFFTVPFAAAPVGQLRWRPPVDFPCPWSGVRNGSMVPPSCVRQRGDGDEDCLFLNIVTPVDVTQTSLLPVLVYYHGTFVYLCSFVSA